jgi:Protein of unknown function (DUF3168).
MNEIAAVSRLITETLSSSEDLNDLVSGVYLRRAPQGAAWPYVVFTPASSVDINTVGSAAPRLMSSLVYNVQVMGVAETADQVDQLERAAALVDSLLTGAQGLIEADTELSRPAIRIDGLFRESSFDYEETAPSSGAAIQHIGGLYRTYATVVD